MSIDLIRQPVRFRGRGLVRSVKGFTLTELLVGVAIGLIGITAMFQVLSLWDRVKRTTAAGSDSQIAGAVGYFRLERDMKQAGMGFGAAQSTVMGCNVAAVINATAATATTPATVARGAFTIPLVPVQIAQGAGGAPDRLTVLYGNSSFFAAEQPFTSSSAVSKKTTSRNGFKVGNAVVVADGASHCDLIEVSDDSNADLLTLGHAGLRFNAAAGTGTTYTSGLLFNLGPLPQLNVWEVLNGSLVVTDALYSNTSATVADGVMDIQAQYGIDNNGDYKVDVWQETDPANWTQLLAIRVALLARSQQFEPTRTEAGAPVYVTSVAPILPWKDSANANIPFLMTNVDGTADSNQKTDNDWRNYRYRVYGGVIPLRNMVWGVSP